MGTNVNKVAIALSEWKAWEEHFEKVLSTSVLKDPAFLREKLSLYNHVQDQYGKSPSAEEKPSCESWLTGRRGLMISFMIVCSGKSGSL